MSNRNNLYFVSDNADELGFELSKKIWSDTIKKLKKEMSKQLEFTAPYLGMKLDYIVEYNYSFECIIGGSHDYEHETLIDYDVEILSITYITQQGKELDYTNDGFLRQEAIEAIINHENQ